MPDLVCLSHLPWAMALERPHQVMRRLAERFRVLFVEDPTIAGGDAFATSLDEPVPNVTVSSLAVPEDCDPTAVARERRRAVAAIAKKMRVREPVLWVYAPSSIGAARDLAPSLLVYDCIDEHAARRGAPLDARAREADLLARADIVFTAGDALFEAKRGRNVSTYPVPNGVDREHFASAAPASSEDRTIGFLGSIDDRVDLELVDAIAKGLPDVRIELAGPLVDLAPEDLPKRRNLRWRGARPYAELPALVARWQLAIVPWRIDEATLRVEPPGILACIAAGVPVLAPPLPAVVERYVEPGVVTIADPAWFPDAVESALAKRSFDEAAADQLLARTSWDRSTKVMATLVREAAMARALASPPRERSRASPRRPA